MSTSAAPAETAEAKRPSGTAAPNTRGCRPLLGGSLRPRHLDALTSEVDVKDVLGVLDQLRAGTFTGRAVVRVADEF